MNITVEVEKMGGLGTLHMNEAIISADGKEVGRISHALPQGVQISLRRDGKKDDLYFIGFMEIFKAVLAAVEEEG